VCEFTNLGSSSIKNKLAHQMAVSIFLHGRGSNLGVVFYNARWRLTSVLRNGQESARR